MSVIVLICEKFKPETETTESDCERLTVAVETGQEIGPVRARTCVPAKDFSKKMVSYGMCAKLSKELSASEIFSRIAVSRPHCTLCKKHLCVDAVHC